MWVRVEYLKMLQVYSWYKPNSVKISSRQLNRNGIWFNCSLKAIIAEEHNHHINIELPSRFSNTLHIIEFIITPKVYLTDPPSGKIFAGECMALQCHYQNLDYHHARLSQTRKLHWAEQKWHTSFCIFFEIMLGQGMRSNLSAFFWARINDPTC